MRIGAPSRRVIVACMCLALSVPLSGGKNRTGTDAEQPGTYTGTAAAGTALPRGGGTAELELTVADAVLIALENNGSLNVARLGPPISRTYVEEERGAFDPSLAGDLSYSSGEDTPGAASSETVTSSAMVNFPIPTGTELGGGVVVSSGNDTSIGLAAELSQELLQGRSRAVNLARVRQAELDSFSSEYELRGFTETLVALVEATYWEYFSLQLKVDIYREGLQLAERGLDEIQERISVGTIPAIDLVAAQAEVALRRETLLDAEGRLEGALLRVIHLLNVPGENPWEARLVTREQPVIPPAGTDNLQAHIASALRMRPDLNQAILAKKRGELEVVQTKNGLLPRLELFIRLGKTAYSRSFSEAAGGLAEGGVDFDASLALSFPIRNREARARNERATLEERQAEIALGNVRRLVELDVRTALVAVRRTREQIDATAATRSLQEAKLRAEMEKFRVGRSTVLLVAQSQRDLLDSQIAEKEALISHLQSLVNLYRLDGSLLLRRGISAPGSEPADR